MFTNPQDTCAQIINTLRTSGLTYSLKETPYSVYLTLRKKFIKEYSPQPLTQLHRAPVDKTSEYENTISKLQEALENELAQHNVTKHELAQTEVEAEKLVDHINNINDKKSSNLSMIHSLQKELAQEVDDHAKSEHALKQLEVKIATLQLELQQKVNHVENINEKNESLTEQLGDAEQVTRELHNTVTQKNQVILLLKDQVKLSQNEISKLLQAQSISPPPITPVLSSSQSGTASGLSHLGTDTLVRHAGINNNESFDENDNLPHNNTSSFSPISVSMSSPFITTPETKASNEKSSTSSPRYRKNCEKYCQNCKNKLPADLDIEIPSPVYFYDFLSECPSPWLHYGYCSPCLEVARSSGTQITQHIAQCPAFIDQCWDGEHEDLVAHYEKTESEKNISDQNDSLPPHKSSSHTHSSKHEPNSPTLSSNHSSPGPYYRTNPDEYCQNCKNEISNEVAIQLPRPVQYFDFITECPSPWLHYGYCTPCLEVARSTGIITEHITQCEALYGQCWEHEHENHILHYQHTEANITSD